MLINPPAFTKMVAPTANMGEALYLELLKYQRFAMVIFTFS